jgi:hypothetical protein
MKSNVFFPEFQDGSEMYPSLSGFNWASDPDPDPDPGR